MAVHVCVSRLRLCLTVALVLIFPLCDRSSQAILKRGTVLKKLKPGGRKIPFAVEVYSRVDAVIMKRDSSALHTATVAAAGDVSRTALEALRRLVDEEITTGILGLDPLALADEAASIVADVVAACGMQQQLRQVLDTDAINGGPVSASQFMAAAAGMFEKQG